MMKLYALIKIQGGAPQIGEGLAYHGYVLHTQKGQWGLYTLSGTKAQLIALGTSDPVNILPIGLNEFPEAAVPDATLNKVNTWMTNNGFETIPLGTSCIVTAKTIRGVLSVLGLLEWEQEGVAEPE